MEDPLCLTSRAGVSKLGTLPLAIQGDEAPDRDIRKAMEVSLDISL